MLPDASELVSRLHHLRAILFTEWTAVGLSGAIVLWLVLSLVRGPEAREKVILGASLLSLAWFASLPIAAAWLAYGVAFYVVVEHGRPRWLARALEAGLLAGMIVGPVLAIRPLGDLGLHVREYTAFATNMAALRFYAYAWDRRRGDAARLPLQRFLLAQCFFPTFVNGPLEAPHQFAPGWGPPELVAGLRRVVVGVGKLMVAGLAFQPGWTQGLARGLEVGVWQLWVWAVLLYAWFYLSFSAWTDVSIGLARLCGRTVPENFAAPWAACDPADFWRRWHLSLGLWLRDYVYIPLGGNRRWRARNVVATFAVSVAWHIWGSVKLLGLGFFGPAAWGGFFLWGSLHSGAVLAAPALRRLAAVGGRPGQLAGAALTFLFAALAWVPFFLPGGVSLRMCLAILFRMVWPF